MRNTCRISRNPHLAPRFHLKIRIPRRQKELPASHSPMKRQHFSFSQPLKAMQKYPERRLGLLPESSGSWASLCPASAGFLPFLLESPPPLNQRFPFLPAVTQFLKQNPPTCLALIQQALPLAFPFLFAHHLQWMAPPIETLHPFQGVSQRLSFL